MFTIEMSNKKQELIPHKFRGLKKSSENLFHCGSGNVCWALLTVVLRFSPRVWFDSQHPEYLSRNFAEILMRFNGSRSAYSVDTVLKA